MKIFATNFLKLVAFSITQYFVTWYQFPIDSPLPPSLVESKAFISHCRTTKTNGREKLISTLERIVRWRFPGERKITYVCDTIDNILYYFLPITLCLVDFDSSHFIYKHLMKKSSTDLYLWSLLQLKNSEPMKYIAPTRLNTSLPVHQSCNRSLLYTFTFEQIPKSIVWKWSIKGTRTHVYLHVRRIRMATYITCENRFGI